MRLPKRLARATRQCIAAVDPLSNAGTQSKARPMHAPVPPETPTRAYSYVRFSTPQQAAGVSFQRQMEKAAAFAQGRGLTLDADLNMADLGVSAFRGKNARTGALAGFLEAVNKGYVPHGSYLLIENIDRLSRDDFFEAQTLFQQLILSGINIAVLSNNEVYSLERLRKQPYDILYIVAEQIRANQESARKSQLIGDAKARAKKRLIEGSLVGRPYTRHTPAWITWSEEERQYKLVNERADIVREIFKMADAGVGVDGIERRFCGCSGLRSTGIQRACRWPGVVVAVIKSAGPDELRRHRPDRYIGFRCQGRRHPRHDSVGVGGITGRERPHQRVALIHDGRKDNPGVVARYLDGANQRK